MVELSCRYIQLYEIITRKEFEFQDGAEGAIADAIQKKCLIKMVSEMPHVVSKRKDSNSIFRVPLTLI